MELVEICQNIRELCMQISDKIDQLGQQLQSQRPDGQKESNETDVLLDYHDVCEILHISIRGIRRLQQTGEIVGVKLGRRRFYRTSEIQAYIRHLAEQRCKTGNNKL